MLFARLRLSDPAVAYLAPGGEAWYWIAGNTVVIKGSWKLQLREPEGCGTRSSPPIYNPATGSVQPGIGVQRHCQADWRPAICMRYSSAPAKCFYEDMFRAQLLDKQPGDPFGLTSQRLPFVLSRTSGSLSALVEEPRSGS